MMTPSGGSSLKDARVLILEDEFLIADDLARALKKAGGTPVGPVSTIAQAEDLVRRQHVDAAIIDFNLHGEMAADFVSRLTATRVPCLIVTGYDRETLPEAIDNVPILEKPITPSSVMKELAKTLGSLG